MKEKIRQIYNHSTLATKIRYSYLLLLIPMVTFLIFCFCNLWASNRNYEDMLNSTVVASEFSLDFKKDFDYETYLLIVENKSVEESMLEDMLNDANRIVKGLEELTDSQENMNRLNSAKKYLNNLEIYKNRIEQNLKDGNKYEDNIEIWENDVQIVTSLLRETIFQYIFFEIKDLQQARTQYQNFFVEMIRFSVVAFAAIFVLITALSYYIPLSITRPIRKLSEVTDQVAKGDLTVRSDVRSGAEVSVLSDSLNTMIDKIDELLEQVKKEQIRLRKAEFELLQSQINPHFLYNTLDAIVWLAEAGEQKKVVSMVGSLSDFFRTSLNQGKDIITIKEELQHSRSYLEIQQMRYQDILNYEIHVPEELHRYLIPKITIQPLVENALYHGIKNKRGLGRIVISGRKEEDFLILQIEDNGIGMRKERLDQVKEGMNQKIPTEKDIYGLYNVNERIRLNFGEKYGLSIESTYGEGTVVSIILPYVDHKSEPE
ncbi:MAG: sensor histidine kinase [Suilimivivens sp.]|nr:sensor histidine kinase [Lachnospiraceae bacterium]MDY5869788.1 sensor histidine kinase [Lachnospiraceae bacterium]